jgi:hypothetical protein
MILQHMKDNTRGMSSEQMRAYISEVKDNHVKASKEMDPFILSIMEERYMRKKKKEDYNLEGIRYLEGNI